MRKIYYLMLMVLPSIMLGQGDLDNSFNLDENVGTDITVRTAAFQPDGKIIIAGTGVNNIVRLLEDGSIDYSFDAGTGADNLINVIALQPDGKILVGGAFNTFDGNTANKFIRLNSDGSIDSNFLSTGANHNITSIELQQNGKIFVSGVFTEFNGDSINKIVRLNTDGTTDVSFTAPVSIDGNILKIEPAPNDKILVGGSFTQYNGLSRSGICRLNQDGSIDLSFSPGTGLSVNGFLREIVVLESGKIAIGGYFTEYDGAPQNNIALINDDGTIDNAFIGYANSIVLTIYETPDNKLLIGGFFSEYDSIPINGFASLNADGSLDTGFLTVGTVTDGQINIILSGSGTDIIIGGTFGTYNGEPAMRIARIHNYCYKTTIWNGTEWSNGQPDSYGYNAIIEGDYSTDEDLQACSLTVNSGNAVIEFGANLKLFNEVVIAEGASLTIETNANLVQKNDVQNSGIITVEKNSSPLYYLDYTVWSSPVEGQKLLQFSPHTLPNRFYTYSTATSSYVAVGSGNVSTTDFEIGKGYLIRMPNTGTPEYMAGNESFVHQGVFTGEPNNGTIPVSVSGSGAGFNLTGNPYPSPININEFFKQNEDVLFPGAAIYFWRKRNNPDATSYATVSNLGYQANSATGGDTGGNAFIGPYDTYVINPGQGFFIKAVPAGGTINFTNSMRRAITNGQFFRNNNNDISTSAISRFWLNITGDTPHKFGQAIIGYTDVTTSGIDYGWDGNLVSDGAVSIYTIAENTELAIQARGQFEASDVVAIGYKAETNGTYTIALDHFDGTFNEGQNIYLKDNTNGFIQDLKTGSYSFTTEAGTFVERFEILYTNQSLGNNPTSIVMQNILVFKQENILKISSGTSNITSLTIHDMRGRVLYSKDGINTNDVELNTLNVEHQVLIVNISTESGFVTKKVIY